jgi:hypothetical protein
VDQSDHDLVKLGDKGLNVKLGPSFIDLGRYQKEARLNTLAYIIKGSTT